MEQRRSPAGTLLCTCGQPGAFFVHWKNETINGKEYGVLRGFCSEDHLAQWKFDGEPDEEAVNEQPVKPVAYRQQSIFD